jgi:hypothetical protein
MSTPGHELPVARASCALTDGALAKQLERYRRLGATAASVIQRDLGLVIRFEPGIDLALLGETIAIERGCCGFFTLDYDAANRQLSITVDDRDRLDALGALASAMRGFSPRSSGR